MKHVLSQLNPVHAIISYFFSTSFNIIYLLKCMDRLLNTKVVSEEETEYF
jgi:hypothetical protein